MICYRYDRKNPLALIVDDEPSMRLTMGAALRKSGFDIVETDNGPAAVSLFQSEKPDLILLDIMMPGMNGFETCQAIRGLPDGALPQILMVTGLDDTDSILKAYEVGANDFVSKPVNLVKLGHRSKYMLRAGLAFQELIRNQNRMAKTQELAQLGNWQIDLVCHRFDCSKEACRLLGLDDGKKNKNLDDMLSTVVAPEKGRIQEQIELAIRMKRAFELNYAIILPSGTRKHISNKAEIISNENGEPEWMLGVVQDVTRLKMAEEEIRYLAFYDGLTGLANRTLFLDRLDQAILLASREKRHFALLFIDLDNFKRVNDTLGHHVGDMVLKNVSETLRANIRKTDTAMRMGSESSDPLISRLGGDEFTVLLQSIRTPEAAGVVARRLVKAIPENCIIDGQEIHITTSIGISIYPEDGDKSDVLLKTADSAMYHAKQSGKSNYQFFRRALNAAAIERFSLEKDLAKALERNELVLYYQPQVDLERRNIVGAEALIRWLHPKKGMIMPDKFIHIAEESGMIVDVNRWVLQETSRFSRRLTENGFDKITVALNVSGYHISEGSISRTLHDAIRNIAMDPANIELEFTESILMQNTEGNIAALEEIKSMCIRIALDDFGTGFSSLSYLTCFPVDTLKIDRSFVMGAIQQKSNRVIIQAIIAMGHSLGLKIVAEGIETREQYELLKSYGCDEAQGFYFKPPIPGEEFCRLLAQRAPLGH